MKRLLSIAILLCLVPTSAHSQEHHNNVLSGRIYDLTTAYPLLNDALLELTDIPITYPLPIVNGVPLRDTIIVNYYRNYADITSICRQRIIPKDTCIELGIEDVPRDGILYIITRNREALLDIPCVNKNDAGWLNAKFGVPPSVFDFTDKHICVIISKRERAIKQLLRNNCPKDSYIMGEDCSRLYILRNYQRNGSFDAFIFYCAKDYDFPTMIPFLF